MADKGFSLVELLVVCALIGIMLFISSPALRKIFSDDPLKTTVRKVIGLVSGVRELAISSQQPYFFYINRLENRLWYKRDLQAAEGGRESTGTLQLPDGIRIEEIMTAGKDVSAVEQVAVWITRQGYMHETSIRFADGTDHAFTLHFLPFVDSVQVTDQGAKVVQ